MRTALRAGSKDATFSGMSVMCGGTRDASGRRSVDFCFRPEPTRVLLIDAGGRGSDLGYEGKEGTRLDVPSRLYDGNVGLQFG